MVLALLLCCIPENNSVATDDTADMLLDYGNGSTKWMTVVSGTTVHDAIYNTLAANGHTCTFDSSELPTIDGKEAQTVGKTGSGSYEESGTTGVTVYSYWQVYEWSSNEWSPISDLTASYSGNSLAVGYYPSGMIPVETPEYKSSWTCSGGDAENTLNQDANIYTGAGETIWSLIPDGKSQGVYGSVLYARGQVIVKFGQAVDNQLFGTIASYNVADGTQNWSFSYYQGDELSTSAPLVAGQYVYVQTADNQIFFFDWRVGPGEDGANVRTIGGNPVGAATPIPESIPGSSVVGGYGYGLTSMVFDSGCVYIKSANGMLYCFDAGLNLVWSYLTGGKGYYTPLTVHGDYVAAGMYDGGLYILNKADGTLIDSKIVYQKTYGGVDIGCVNTPIFVEDSGKHYIFATYNDGRGMNTTTYGIAIFTLSGGKLTTAHDYLDTYGSTCNRMTLAQDFKGVYFNSDKGTYTLKTDGTCELLSDFTSGRNVSHNGSVLVNNQYLFSTTYSTHKLILIEKDGTVVGTFDSPLNNYCMITPTIVDGYILCGDDSGAYVVRGDFDPYVPPVHEQSTLERIIPYVAGFFVALGAIWGILRFGLKWEKPFSHMIVAFKTFLYGEQYTHNTRSKHRLWLVLLIGLVLTLILALFSLCLGPETTLGPGDALSALFSSISKGGEHLTYEEMLIYNSRLPRTITALAVGIGLSVAGAVYQAVIKNPLVEPYIMGVSSGAGTLAIAVIMFDFTFFGLFQQQSPFLTAIAAIVGGLLAFGLTMLLAEKTGGKSMNYVLAGIIIGLVFSAVQSLMMVMGGNNVQSALSWLYGSFTSMTWEKIWIVLIPVITLSLIPYLWSKELNLVLLGEDQARQMGLDARRFDRWMLIIASILTAFCVAFAGVIGFVGLVVPHLCRMILGGDHRLMLPASMAFGGVLMIAADVLARVLVSGYELPVGAITTVIGVPVFAYLLIKRGKSYDM